MVVDQRQGKDEREEYEALSVGCGSSESHCFRRDRGLDCRGHPCDEGGKVKKGEVGDGNDGENLTRVFFICKQGRGGQENEFNNGPRNRNMVIADRQPGRR